MCNKSAISKILNNVILCCDKFKEEIDKDSQHLFVSSHLLMEANASLSGLLSVVINNYENSKKVRV